MTTAQAIVDRARATLIDAAKVTWTDAELLGYLNAGIAQACGTLLDLYVKAAMVALVAGVRQALPADGIVLFDITRNAAGGAITQAAMSEFQRTKDDWPGDAQAVVRYFFYDHRAPTSFLVWPAAVAAAQVELLYAAIPAAVALADPIPINPAFDTALWAYITGLAFSKNTKRQDMGKTTTFLSLFNGILDTWKKGNAAMTKVPDAKGQF